MGYSVEIQKVIQTLEKEIENVKKMTLEEAQVKYNCDDDIDTIVEYLEDDLGNLNNKLQDAIDYDYQCCYGAPDPAFKSWEQINQMFCHV